MNSPTTNPEVFTKHDDREPDRELEEQEQLAAEAQTQTIGGHITIEYAGLRLEVGGKNLSECYSAAVSIALFLRDNFPLKAPGGNDIR
jgi:hypothetical protein